MRVQLRPFMVIAVGCLVLAGCDAGGVEAAQVPPGTARAVAATETVSASAATSSDTALPQGYQWMSVAGKHRRLAVPTTHVLLTREVADDPTKSADAVKELKKRGLNGEKLLTDVRSGKVVMAVDRRTEHPKSMPMIWVDLGWSGDAGPAVKPDEAEQTLKATKGTTVLARRDVKTPLGPAVALDYVVTTNGVTDQRTMIGLPEEKSGVLWAEVQAATRAQVAERVKVLQDTYAVG